MSPASALPIGLMGFALMASALANRTLLETAPRPAQAAAAGTLQTALSLVNRVGGEMYRAPLCLVRGD